MEWPRGQRLFRREVQRHYRAKVPRKLIHIRTYRNWGKSMTNIIETDYLYHYTSLEKLALILKNRTIRLSPLDKMDDRQEQKTSDVENRIGDLYL